jgi:hypothetical protein
VPVRPDTSDGASVHPHACERTTPHAWCSLSACPAAAVLLLAGCGGSSGAAAHKQAPRSHRVTHQTTMVSAGVIAESARLSAAEPGYTVKLSLRVNARQLGGEATATGSGAYDAHGGEMGATLKLPGVLAIITPLTTPVIISDGMAYVEVPSALVSEGIGLKPWLSVSLSGADKLLGLPATALTGALTPRTILEALASDSTGRAERLGEQRIDGVRTVPYRELVRQFGSGSAVDVWVDAASGLLRRIVLNASPNSSGTGAEIDFTAYGPQKVPAAPPASQVGALAAALKTFGI